MKRKFDVLFHGLSNFKMSLLADKIGENKVSFTNIIFYKNNARLIDYIYELNDGKNLKQLDKTMIEFLKVKDSIKKRNCYSETFNNFKNHQDVINFCKFIRKNNISFDEFEKYISKSSIQDKNCLNRIKNKNEIINKLINNNRTKDEAEKFYEKFCSVLSAIYDEDVKNDSTESFSTIINLIDKYKIKSDPEIVSLRKGEACEFEITLLPLCSFETEDELKIIFEYMDKKIKEDNFQRKIDKQVWMLNRLMVKITYDNALRISEVVGIKMEDINLEEGNKFYIRGKGHNGNISRFNVFKKDTVELLKEYLDLRNKIKIKNGNEEYLFISPLSKSKITDNSLRKFFKKILDELNIDYNSPMHDIRHTKATELIAKDVEVKKVSMYLGHTSERITEKYYIHQTDKVMEELSEL